MTVKQSRDLVRRMQEHGVKVQLWEDMQGVPDKGKPMNIVAWLSGKKTYLAVAGLIGLAVYQVSQGQYEQAIQTAIAAAAAAGLRSAVAKVETPK